MRIALFTNEYPPNVYGGAGVHVEYLSRELARAESGAHRVDVLCFGEQHEIRGNLRVRGVAPALRFAARNFYENDTPTGAVVGQQPFAGGRASGTNDKAGSLLNLLRWTNPRAIKENFDPPRDWRYRFLSPG